MPSLRESLEGKDLGYLGLVAECWGIEAHWSNKNEGAKELSRQILDAGLFHEVFAALPDESQKALAEIKARGKRLLWTQFERKYGVIRSMGPAQRAKLQPQRAPQSTGEILWYRALIGRAFMDSESGPQEFAFIPNDIQAMMPESKDPNKQRFGRSALPKEITHVRRAGDRLLDDLTSFLGAKRSQFDLIHAADIEDWQTSIHFMDALLRLVGVLEESGDLGLEALERFLTQDRGAAMQALQQAWRESPQFNELKLLPNLRPEGEWSNSPAETRSFLLKAMHESAAAQWIQIDSFIADVHAEAPDFQRTGGQYDTWFLKDVETEEFLSGFQSWERVEGELIRFFVTVIAYWLDLVQLGATSEDGNPNAFRINADSPGSVSSEEGKLTIDSQGLVQIPPDFPRAIRYQISRFCDWEGRKKGIYQYRIRARSLKRAKGQSLPARRLLPLLEKHADSPLPPTLTKAIQRWEKEGSPAKAEQMLVLRVGKPEILEELRTSRVKRYLGEVLGPNAIQIQSGAKRHVLQALTEMGYLAEFDEDGDE